MLLRRALIALAAALGTVPMVSASAILVVLNAALCAQLSCSPQAQRRIGLLEAGSLFCCVVQAVAGVLLFPSLDRSNECVGSTYLDRIGAVCDSNSQYKAGVVAIVLAVFAANLLTSLAMFLSHLRHNRAAAAAARGVHRALGLPFDAYDIHLSGMISGRHLARLLRDPRLAGSAEVRGLFARLDRSLSGFVLFNHGKSGHFARDEYARTLSRLLAAFPGLLDWALRADRAVVARLAAFVEDYAAYAREHHSEVFGEIIQADYRPSLLVWLATCEARHRRALCKLLLGVATASGMTYFLRPGEVREQLLADAGRYAPAWRDAGGGGDGGGDGEGDGDEALEAFFEALDGGDAAIPPLFKAPPSPVDDPPTPPAPAEGPPSPHRDLSGYPPAGSGPAAGTPLTGAC